MRFLYVFAMMFLSIFGLAVLLKILVGALLDSSSRKFRVYVRDEEGIEEFLDRARKAAFIDRVIVITDKSGEELREISEKYADVGFIGDTDYYDLQKRNGEEF